MKQLLLVLSAAREEPVMAFVVAAHIAFGLIILDQGLDWLFGLFTR